MLRLSTFFLLLALVTAQNGYEYNRPGKPFSQGSSSSRPGIGSSSTYPATTSFAVRPQAGDYGSSTPGYSPESSNYPNGQSYPGSTSQRPQPGYPGASYPGQTGQVPSGPSITYPGAPYPGLNGISNNVPGQGSFYSGQVPRRPSGGFPGSRYPGVTGTNGFGQGSHGFGSDDSGAYINGDYSAIPGRPDIDYPIYSDIPHTSFSCNNQAYPGYYADVETRCQAFHVCANNKTYDFLCPNGTVFSQEVFVCVWWNEFDCHSAPSLYGLNANLYDYSIVGSPGGFHSSGLNGPQSRPGQRPPGLFEKYPINSTPGILGPQGPLSGHPGTSRPQTSTSYPENSVLQGPSTGHPSSIRPLGPSTSYPGVSGPLIPSSGHQGSPGIFGPALNYPGSSQPHGPSTIYPGSAISQGPSTSYPGSYPGSSPHPVNSGLRGPSTSYPSTTGTRGPSSYPGSQGSSYPGTGPNGSYPGDYSGYPSGKPSGPGFPNGSGVRPQQPNREYLPPRN